jgi:hypothetical protein
MRCLLWVVLKHHQQCQGLLEATRAHTAAYQAAFQLTLRRKSLLLLNRYFDYVNFNNTGFRPYDITLWAVMVGSARKCISRMLLLVVAMGYGVVRPTLGGLTKKVTALGGAYFIAACTLDVMTNVGTIDDLTSSARIFLVLPVAVLDAVFILWIFTALSKTLAQLQV